MAATKATATILMALVAMFFLVGCIGQEEKQETTNTPPEGQSSDRGWIYGVVSDDKGAGIKNAGIFLSCAGANFTSTTNDTGFYTIANLTSGEVQATVKYQSMSFTKNATILNGRGAEVNFELNVSKLNEETKELKVLVDADDVIVYAYALSVDCARTEKQPDGKWIIQPYRKASEITVDLSWESNPMVGSLSIRNYEPTNETSTSKKYVIPVDPDMWGEMFEFMILPSNDAGLATAINMKYHITIKCNGAPPPTPTKSTVLKIEGDIIADSVIFEVMNLNETSQNFEVTKEVSQMEIVVSASPSVETLRFYVKDGQGTTVAWEGNDGTGSGIPAPLPMTATIYAVKNVGEWTLYILSDINVACHYIIEITLYS